jgi:hypothetical protein
MVISNNLRLGVPTKNGFAGLALEVDVPVLALAIAGVTVVGAIWAATRARQTVPDGATEVTVGKFGTTRAVVSSN